MGTDLLVALFPRRAEPCSDPGRPVPLTRPIALYQTFILMLAFWTEHEQAYSSVLRDVLNNGRALRWLILSVSTAWVVIDHDSTNAALCFVSQDSAYRRSYSGPVPDIDMFSYLINLAARPLALS